MKVSRRSLILSLAATVVFAAAFSHLSVANQATNRRSPLSALVKDTVCKGVCTQVGTSNYPMTLYVIERKEEMIKVAISYPTSPCMEIAVGTISDDKLFLSLTEPVGAKAMSKCTYTGRLNGKTVVLGTWEGENAKRKRVSGSFRFKLPSSR